MSNKHYDLVLTIPKTRQFIFSSSLIYFLVQKQLIITLSSASPPTATIVDLILMTKLNTLMYS